MELKDEADRRVVGGIGLEPGEWGRQYKAKVTLQLRPGYHVRSLRIEMLDGRVTFIVAANSDHATALRQEAVNGD
jgi:hypothetical protein